MNEYTKQAFLDEIDEITPSEGIVPSIDYALVKAILLICKILLADK